MCIFRGLLKKFFVFSFISLMFNNIVLRLALNELQQHQEKLDEESLDKYVDMGVELIIKNSHSVDDIKENMSCVIKHGIKSMTNEEG